MVTRKKKKVVEPDVKRAYSDVELAKLPTLHSGHFADTKVQGPDGYTVLLMRIGPADDYKGPPVAYETLAGGKVVPCNAFGVPIPEKVDNITIIGRRWFRKSAGNSYCTAEIHVNGVFVIKLGPTSGYDRYYEQIADEWLWSNGYYERLRETEPLWQIKAREGFTVTSTAIDVAREKDL